MYLFINPDNSFLFQEDSQKKENQEDLPINLFLKGIIFGQNVNSLLRSYIQEGFSFLKDANGNYYILIFDKRNGFEKAHLITDKVNSLKIFISVKEKGIQISDDIDLFEKEKLELNPQAIACYIANGNMLNGLTLFKGVTMAEGGCIYTFENGKMNKEKYWEADFDYKPYSKKLELEYSQELKKKLKTSIEKSLKESGERILISLSAGYDARGILGLIKNLNPQKTVETFTYRPSEKIIPGSDADLSEKISKSLGYNHIGLKSYENNFISTLKQNAEEGKCLANFCDEIDAIKRLSSPKKYSDVFAGDEWFGRLDVPLNTTREILDSVSIVGSWGITWLKKILETEQFDLFKKEIEDLTDKILKPAKKLSNPHDKKDFLYLTQRIPYVNLIWREYFTSQLGRVHNPFLDGEILDFYKKTPPELRLEKGFFIKVIRDLLPKLFEIPIARERRSLTGINYQEEIIRNKEEIIHLVKNNDSYLESYISKNQVIQAITLLEKENFSLLKHFFINIKKSINAIRRLSKSVDILLYPILGSRTVKTPGREKIVLRLLLLWIYLIKKQKSNP